MSETMALGLQESVEREIKSRTLLDFLREDMDSVERTEGGQWRCRKLKERLGFKGIGCCGATWRSNATSSLMNISEDDEEEDVQSVVVDQISIPIPAENSTNQVCVGQIPAVNPGMNLATALAAERNFRATEGGRAGPTVSTVSSPSTPLRVSLMRLLQEGDGVDGGEKEMERAVEGGSNDTVCCVCMERRKGAAFIPCGHTFCRVCTRDIWLNRGSCAICNRSIVEILDIF